MKNQTLMGPLVELAGWLQAPGWGLLSAAGLLIGAVGGYLIPEAFYSSPQFNGLLVVGFVALLILLVLSH
jgi:hypothetical protein